MATPNVDKMSLKDLLELESKVQKAISAARDRERSEVKQALAQLAEKRGFSVNELFGGRGRGKSSAAKFVNPDNKAETWTGRGRKPNWPSTRRWCARYSKRKASTETWATPNRNC